MDYKREYQTPPNSNVGRHQQHHMKEAYSRAGLMTVLWVAMRVSFYLPHPVALSAFIICRGLCMCTEML